MPTISVFEFTGRVRPDHSKPTGHFCLLSIQTKHRNQPKACCREQADLFSYRRDDSFGGDSNLYGVAKTHDATLLSPAGWTHCGGDLWRRPGKTSGWSASTQTGFLVVYSNSPETGLPCEPNGADHSTFSPFAAYSFLNHGGDFKAAAKELGSKGYGSSASQRITFHGIDIGDLSVYADQPVDWLVQDVFSADQPAVFGARVKCLKTTLKFDQAVSFATGGDWLGHFKVPRKRKVLLITGEANTRAVSRKLKRACRAHGTTFTAIAGMIRVEAMHFPKLPSATDCLAVQETVNRYGIEVVMIDPLYRGFTADTDTNKMAQVGDAIVTFAKSCQPASLILSHHTTKSAAREYGRPPELEDMTGAGIAEAEPLLVPASSSPKLPTTTVWPSAATATELPKLSNPASSLAVSLSNSVKEMAVSSLRSSSDSMAATQFARPARRRVVFSEESQDCINCDSP